MSNPKSPAQNAVTVRNPGYWLEKDQADLAQFYVEARTHNLQREATVTSRAATAVGATAVAAAAVGLVPVGTGIAILVGAVTTGLFTRLALNNYLKEVQASSGSPQQALAWARKELKGAVRGLRLASVGAAGIAAGFAAAAVVAPVTHAMVVFGSAAAVWCGVSWFAHREMLPKRRHQLLLEPPRG